MTFDDFHKFKILLTNYRYFISGGPERYLFNLQKKLTQQGHSIVPFSVDYNKNRPTAYSKYFVSPIGSRDQVYFEQHGKSPAIVLKTLSRLFYSREVEKAVLRIVDEQQPQLAYILHYLRKLSPSLLVGLKKKNIPIVVRLSDYAMLCPQAHCLRNGSPCTLCVDGKLLPSIQHKCLKASMPASLLNAMATWYHKSRKFFDLIDMFVCTNEFMYKMMVEAGYPRSKLLCIPTFTDTVFFSPITNYKKSDYILYCGRLTELKGVHILLEAYALLQQNGYRDIRLKIAGASDSAYYGRCRKIVERNNLTAKVDFIGKVATETLPLLFSKALFTVVPSLWFENLPNSILESFSCGTPVLASNIGSLNHCVTDGKTGYLFDSGCAEDLAGKIKKCLSNPSLLEYMSINSRNEAKIKYSPEKHIVSLISLFSDLLSRSS